MYVYHDTYVYHGTTRVPVRTKLVPWYAKRTHARTYGTRVRTSYHFVYVYVPVVVYVRTTVLEYHQGTYHGTY